MQIDSGLPSTLSGLNRYTANSLPPADQPDSADSLDSAADVATQGAASPSQDDAVQISAEGAAASADDSTASDSAQEDASADSLSAAKSFAYGTLGLERPDQPQEQQNTFYSAGRWLAAGITLGGIISLLV